MTDAHWPTDISVNKAARTLSVTFESGESFILDAEYLRVESPSAEVMGHGPDQRKWITGKETVGIEAIEQVGNYAVRITFDDKHDTGLYSWDYLYELGRNREAKWTRYCEKTGRDTTTH